MEKTRRSLTWLIPIFVVVLFSTTSLTSFAATKHVGLPAMPNIGSGDCSHIDYLHIYYNGGQNVVCFSGDGYTGASLPNVTDIVGGNNCGWVMVYSDYWSGGKLFTFDGFYGYYTAFHYNNLVTQIKIVGQDCTLG